MSVNGVMGILITRPVCHMQGESNPVPTSDWYCELTHRSAISHAKHLTSCSFLLDIIIWQLHSWFLTLPQSNKWSPFLSVKVRAYNCTDFQLNQLQNLFQVGFYIYDGIISIWRFYFQNREIPVLNVYIKSMAVLPPSLPTKGSRFHFSDLCSVKMSWSHFF